MQYVYDNCNTFNVTLTVTDSNGCTHDTTITVTVHCPPIVNFTSSIECQGDSTIFTPTTDTLVTGNSIVDWNWSFGSNVANDSFNFDTCGIDVIDVTLTVIDNQLPACTASVTNPISINCNPTANFTWTDTCESFPTIFTNTSTNGGTGPIITQWNWNMGVATGNYVLLTTNTSPNPRYEFNTSSSYPINLEITDTDGCLDDTTIIVTVYSNPIAIIDSVLPVCEGDTTLFTNSSINGSAPINTWSWNM